MAGPQRQKEGEGSREEEEEEEEREGDEVDGGQKAGRRKQLTPVKNKSAAPAPHVKQVARKSTAAVKVCFFSSSIGLAACILSQMGSIAGWQETSSG